MPRSIIIGVYRVARAEKTRSHAEAPAARCAVFGGASCNVRTSGIRSAGSSTPLVATVATNPNLAG